MGARGLDEKACETLPPLDNELRAFTALRHSGTLRIHINTTLNFFFTHHYLPIHSLFLSNLLFSLCLPLHRISRDFNASSETILTL